LDGVGEAEPGLGFLLELGAAGAGEGIVFGFAAAFGGDPIGFEEAFVLEAVEGGIEAALGNVHDGAADLAEALGDAVAVDGTERDDFQDEQVEGALGEIGFGERQEEYLRLLLIAENM
jgi:hypothetical protein